MIDLSPEAVVVVMFGLALVLIMLGFPLAFVFGGLGVVIGLLTLGWGGIAVFRARMWALMCNYTFLAGPLFIYMGLMLDKSGAAEKLYNGLYVFSGRMRGSLAIGTIVMATLLAASVGVISASIIMMGLIAVPSMVSHNYQKELVCGTICAGGSLGILIPPSLMLVVYGPMANLSVGKLFMGAFGPGLLLSACYILYVLIRATLNPSLAPAISEDEIKIPFLAKLGMLLKGVAPPILLIVTVLGAIFFGIASPTEAAALGAVAATLLAVAFRRFNLSTFKDVILSTTRIISMTLIIGWTACMFVGVFLRLGAGSVITNFVMGAPFGNWGAFALVMILVFLLGFIMDWIGIVFIMIPLISPLAEALGFDPIWFAMMICVNLQMSFLTPPFAPAIFYLKAILKPELGIETGHIIRGVVPFVLMIAFVLILCIIFPDIIMWLPDNMVKG